MKRQTEFNVLRPGLLAAPDRVVEEVPVAFEYNGISHTVMLATPDDLEDFALGFSLSEGVLSRPDELHDIEIEETGQGIVLRLEIAGGAFFQLKRRRRSLAGRTGCGLCGAESLTQVMRDLSPVTVNTLFGLEALQEAIHHLPSEQRLQQSTGAVHAACHVAADGVISHVREDVGRHNALDKTLGSLAGLRQNEEGGLLVTSRASFEMVQKAAALGYGLLAAVSAPTAAAVRLADQLNLTLIGFLRGSDCAIYTHPSRLRIDTPASKGCQVYPMMEKTA
jgi:FdhD protein